MSQANSSRLTQASSNQYPVLFRELTGTLPYSHQELCARFLQKGRPVILRAPTGSGKSEAVWVPWYLWRNGSLPGRLIHVLPMRVLANQLGDRLRQVVHRHRAESIRVAVQHGQRLESVLFWSEAVMATLDQVATSYACVPLSLGIRHGNIPAGAVVGSFLVFDEVHLFEPQLGFQVVRFLAGQLQKLGIPWVLMSATLPQAVLEKLAGQLGAEIVVVEPDKWSNRCRQVCLKVNDCPLDVGVIRDAAERGFKRVLVFVNAVRRAQELYQELKGQSNGAGGYEVMVVHSRYTDDDRERKEQQIIDRFQREGDGRTILITTQVVEVGLDISAELVISECAPADALVQRAGRCARWGGEGEFWIYRSSAGGRPYEAELVEKTWTALQDFCCGGSVPLDWQLETELVDRVLTHHFEPYCTYTAQATVIARLSAAAFKGSPLEAQRAVRELNTVELSVHSAPESLGPAVLRLPRIRVDASVFESFAREQEDGIWQVTVDRQVNDEYRPGVSLRKVAGRGILSEGFYVVDPAAARYDPEFGLQLGVAGEPLEPLEPSHGERRTLDRTRHLESWQEHVRKVVEAFEQMVYPIEQFPLRRLAERLKRGEEELGRIVRMVLVLHDIGKLTEDWQRAIRKELPFEVPEDTFLAHRPDNTPVKLPFHATVSAWIAMPLLMKLGEPLCRWAYLAIAHHHSVRASQVPVFQMRKGWFEVVKECLAELAGMEVSREDFYETSPRAPANLILTMINPSESQPYISYVLLSRWLRLADRIATGGRDAVLRYEGWFGNL